MTSFRSGGRSWLRDRAPGAAALALGCVLAAGSAAAADEPTSSPESVPAAGMAVMVPIAPAATGPTKERYFGAGARIRFVAVPKFVLGLIGLQDSLGAFKEGFGIDLGYRSMTLEDGRVKGGFDIGLSFFWDDYRFSRKKGVVCSDFEAGGPRAGSDPLNCSAYYPNAGNAGNIAGGFFREDGDPTRETEYRLQNFRMMGAEITIDGWWALNPFFHLDLGASIGGGVVLGKMVYFDTYATAAGQAIDDRTPCATMGVKPGGGMDGTGCQEVQVEETSVPPALPILRLWVGATFSITKNVEIRIRGGVGAPSIFHADAGVYLWF